MDLQTNLRNTADAMTAFQVAAEAYLIWLYDDANLCCIDTWRVMIMSEDILLARQIWGEWR